MLEGVNVAAAAVAGIIATIGLWWFHLMLKSFMARQTPIIRYGVYGAIWLAYFVLVMLLAARQGGAGA
ncbi:MAG: hypothetical protein RIC52_13210 [Amphiplicatus sp.]